MQSKLNKIEKNFFERDQREYLKIRSAFLNYWQATDSWLNSEFLKKILDVYGL